MRAPLRAVAALVAVAPEPVDGEHLEHAVLEALDEGVMLVDLEGHLVHANAAACAVLGLDLATARADPEWWKPLSPRHSSDDTPPNVARTVLETGRAVRDVDVDAARPDGTSLQLSVNYQPLRDASGAITGLVLSFRDVTERERENRRLSESDDRLREAHEVARLASWEWRPETGEVTFIHAPADAGDLPGNRAPLEDLLGAMPPEGSEPIREDLAAMLRGERDAAVRRFLQPHPSGAVWLETRSRAVRDADGQLVCVRGTTQDVSEQERALSTQRQVVTQAALLDEVDVAVIATDLEGHITHWNRGAERLHGWAHAEVEGRHLAKLFVEDEADMLELDAELGRGGQWEGERNVRHKDGSSFPAHLRGRIMVDVDGQPAGWTFVSVDMSKRVESERALRAASNYLRAVADSVGEGLFTLDTEGRLTYMNEAAEKLLGWSQEALQGRLMHPVLHPHAPRDHHDGVHDVCPLNGQLDGETRRVDDDVFVSCDGRELTVAYTAAPFETDDGVQGCVIVFEDISKRKAHEESLLREAEKLGWIGRIQDTLTYERFLLYAQPIVDLSSGAIVQHELLLRLREDDGGIVTPASFLPIAEQYGLVGDIDRWVVSRAAVIAATGRPVEINLSAHSIGDQAILEHIERCIAGNGIDPTLLVFEITETALIADEASARRFADRLRHLGCRLALDDFGTGYGGFTYLKQLPLDFLKIDLEFVRDLAANPASRHVVQAVVALARGFELQTVAEGVEDLETFDRLRELGVDFAQGYYIARPGPLDDTIGSPNRYRNEPA